MGRRPGTPTRRPRVPFSRSPAIARGTATGRIQLPLGQAFPEVLAAARTGAPWALSRLYEDLSPAVAGYLRVQRANEPEDLTSEVFLGVFSGLDSFEGGEPQFRSWVFTIAHRRLLDERRRAVRRPHPVPLDAEQAGSGGDVEREAMAALGERWVVDICDQLSPDQRTVLLLRVVADLTSEEVARVTGRTLGAVKALQRRGLAALRRRLAREGVPR